MEELERIVLAQLIGMRDAYARHAAMLTDGCFVLPEHKVLYKAVKLLHESRESIDPVTVWAAIPKPDRPWPAISGLLELCGAALIDSHLESHIAILREREMRGLLINMCLEVGAKAANAEDIFTLLDECQVRLQKIDVTDGVGMANDGKALMKACMDEYDRPQTLPSYLLPISAANRLFDGFRGGDLVYVAGRPGMGKMAFALNACLASAEASIPGVFYSIEMSMSQVSQRLVAAKAGLPLMAIRERRLKDDGLLAATSCGLEKLPLWVDAPPRLSIRSLRSKIYKTKTDMGIRYAVIDYLGLMDAGNRYKGQKVNEIGEISRELKLIAREFDIVIVALHQLSREVEKRGDKKPMLADLRDSGNIEQDADQVLFLYRPEYYGLDASPDGELYGDGYAELICAKNRHGDVGAYPCVFDKYCQRFAD